MAQRHHEDDAVPAGEIDDARVERLRHDPDVFVYHRTTDEPFVPTLRVSEQVDVLWLLGRGCTDDEEAVFESSHRP